MISLCTFSDSVHDSPVLSLEAISGLFIVVTICIVRLTMTSPLDLATNVSLSTDVVKSVFPIGTIVS